MSNLLTEAAFDPERWLNENPDGQYIQVPLIKSYATDSGDWVVEGVASCEEPDSDVEKVLQKGMDTAPLLECGYFNWDHKDGLGAEFLIGIPEEAVIASASDFKEQLGKSLDGLAFYVRGKLFQHKDKPKAREVWSHLQAMRDLKVPRTLGWSVQGHILERDRMNPRLVTRSVCRQLAITHQPKQRYTFAQLAKSFGETDATLQQSMTTATAVPLLKENFGKRVTDLLLGDCKHGCLNAGGQFQRGVRSALQHMVLCKGYSLDESTAALETLVKSGITRRWMNE